MCCTVLTLMHQLLQTCCGLQMSVRHESCWYALSLHQCLTSPTPRPSNTDRHKTENACVAAAVDIWLAGPVAHALAQQSDCTTDSGSSSMCHYNSYHSLGDDNGPCSAMITLLPPSMTKTSSRSCCLQLMVSDDSSDDSTDSTARRSTAQNTPLDAAVTLLINSVRLSQCSGAFLAAAVERMPWLCKALQHKAGDLQLLQQYYR